MSYRLAWRNKKLLPGSELAGKRVGIQIDVGRLKTRGAMTLKGGGLVPPAEKQVQTEPTKNAIEHNAKLREKITKGLYRVYRKLIREGRWEVVVLAFKKRLDRRKNLSDVSRDEIRCVINYRQRHGEQGHLAYPQFGLLGIPLGSGAVESSIRRVINLRLKSNGSFPSLTTPA